MTLKVGLIGCGFIGRFHSAGIRNIVRSGSLDIQYTIVCDQDEARARSFADITGARSETDAMVVIGSQDVDVVYICVPTRGHRQLVLEAASNGKHIFCEKPLSTNLADVQDMVEAVSAAGVKAGVGFVLRHSPVLTVLKDLLEDGSLGRMMTIVFRDDQFYPITGHYGSDWRKDLSLAGGGALLEHSIHDIDVLRWLGGDVASVRGDTSNFAGNEGIEDLATAHLEFQSGAKATLVSVWHSVVSRPSTRHIEVFMEKGVFWTDHDFLGPIYYQAHAQNEVTIPEEEVLDRYLGIANLRGARLERMIRFSFEDYLFLDAIIRDRDPFPGFALGLEAHKVVDAIYRSAAAGGERIAL